MRGGLRSRRARITSASVLIVLFTVQLTRALIHNNSVGILFFVVLAMGSVALLVSAIRDRPLPTELTLPMLRRLLLRSALVAAALMALAAFFAIITLTSPTPRPVAGLTTAGAFAVMALLIGSVALRTWLIVRRGEVPPKVRERYEEAVRRRNPSGG